jgi:hypothetical protein
MNRNRRWLAIGVGLAAVAVAVGLTLALTGNGGSKQFSHSDFAVLWSDTNLGDPEQAVLARWPKVPYQHYKDNLKDDCYEWEDVPDPSRGNMPRNIFNLCFKGGVLRTKDIL